MARRLYGGEAAAVVEERLWALRQAQQRRERRVVAVLRLGAVAGCFASAALACAVFAACAAGYLTSNDGLVVLATAAAALIAYGGFAVWREYEAAQVA